MMFQRKAKFQYNSCYCLSVNNGNINTSYRNFNTTLVIVYHGDITFSLQGKSFQYNSCYCLSKRPPESRLHWKRFQYNSCYCLSISTGQGVSSFFNFNTTLVIVYRFRSTEEPLQGSYFNTTLVIVYPTLLSHFCFLL